LNALVYSYTLLVKHLKEEGVELAKVKSASDKAWAGRRPRPLRSGGPGLPQGASLPPTLPISPALTAPIPLHIDHIRMCHPPMKALMSPKVSDPIKIKMTKAGMVATAHFTMRTTIDMKGILMSVTTIFPTSADIRVSS
jgi:hypothetical protein